MIHQCRVFLLATKEFLGANSRRRVFTYMKRPRHEVQRFGGRACRLASPSKNAPKHLQERTTRERMIAVYESQEITRRQWKARDYEVYELPWSLAPAELRRVVPELHTECPIQSHNNGVNLRYKVFDRTDISPEVYNNVPLAYPKIPNVTARFTLDKMLVF